MVSDKTSSIVIESTKKGIKIYDNFYGVLTNNPEFSYHLENMNNYINLSPNIKRPLFSDQLSIISNGLSTTGLPGGLSSIDRFVRVAYTKLTSISLCPWAALTPCLSSGADVFLCKPQPRPAARKMRQPGPEPSRAPPSAIVPTPLKGGSLSYKPRPRFLLTKCAHSPI